MPAASPHAVSRPPACSPSLTKNLLPPPSSPVSVSAMLVSMRQKNIAQVSILERYFFVSTYQAAGPDTCLAVFVVASLPPCL